MISYQTKGGAMNEHEKLTLGLDWDGVISDYSKALRILLRYAHTLVVITLNDAITSEIAGMVLRRASDTIFVEICPQDRLDDYDVWKKETCLRYKIGLMLDDDPKVLHTCKEAGIHTILIAENPRKHQDDDYLRINEMIDDY